MSVGWYVNYSVTRVGKNPQRYQAGPYETPEIAIEQMHDIETYSGVSLAYVMSGRDETSTLIAS